jgi:ferrous iron transport protein A
MSFQTLREISSRVWRFRAGTTRNDDKEAAMWSVKPHKSNALPEANPTARTLADLSAGQRAQIACIECPHAASCERLMAYGLVQGQTILLVQKHPAFVIRVDETELALDELVARCIHIHPVRA